MKYINRRGWRGRETETEMEGERWRDRGSERDRKCQIQRTKPRYTQKNREYNVGEGKKGDFPSPSVTNKKSDSQFTPLFIHPWRINNLEKWSKFYTDS